MHLDPHARPDRHDYFMGIAMAVRRRANCLGSRIGAIVVLDQRIVSTGYNGTPEGMANCLEGGCTRCAHPEAFQPGTGYDLCICVHAEQNALLAAARFGIAVQGGAVYTTLQPCFGCTKEMLQAGIQSVYYLHEWRYPDPGVHDEYERLQGHFPGGVHRLGLADPDEDWALSAKRRRTPPAADDTGHPAP